MPKIFTAPIGFVASYVALVVIIYWMALVGANAFLSNGALAYIFGMRQSKPIPLGILCASAIAIVTLAFFRGKKINRIWLAAFPLLAAGFDLLPIFSENILQAEVRVVLEGMTRFKTMPEYIWFFIPQTILHLFALFFGIFRVAQ